MESLSIFHHAHECFSRILAPDGIESFVGGGNLTIRRLAGKNDKHLASQHERTTMHVDMVLLVFVYSQDNFIQLLSSFTPISMYIPTSLQARVSKLQAAIPRQRSLSVEPMDSPSPSPS